MKSFLFIQPTLLAVITFSALSPVLQTFASESTQTHIQSASATVEQPVTLQPDAPIFTVSQNSNEPENISDGAIVSMDEVMDNWNLTLHQRNEVLETVMYIMQHTKQTRSRYYKSSYTISAEHVKSMAKMNTKVLSTASGMETVASLIAPGATAAVSKYLVVAAAALYGSYWWQVKTAASHGWGLRVTLTVDSYTPTTAGMQWSVSYVK